jgi:type IV secretory pathway TraG/TraD family ATPase VirD4
MNIVATYADLTHGSHGFILFYVLIAVFSLAGLKRGHAPLEQYLFWPFTALATMVVVGLSTQVLIWVLEKIAGKTVVNAIDMLVSALIIMAGGYLGGLYWAARSRPMAAVAGRGAMVFDGAAAQVATQKQRKQALGKPGRNFPLTVAGVAVPLEDETKHFKFMGTTEVGKSSAMRELPHAALYRGDRAIIADPDGGYLSRFYVPRRGDVILNPFDARSAKWNFFGELRNAYDVDQLARAMISDRAGSDTTWTSYARTFFSAVVRQAQESGITDLGEVYRLLTAAPQRRNPDLGRGDAGGAVSGGGK